MGTRKIWSKGKRKDRRTPKVNMGSRKVEKKWDRKMNGQENQIRCMWFFCPEVWKGHCKQRICLIKDCNHWILEWKANVTCGWQYYVKTRWIFLGLCICMPYVCTIRRTVWGFEIIKYVYDFWSRIYLYVVKNAFLYLLRHILLLHKLKPHLSLRNTYFFLGNSQMSFNIQSFSLNNRQ